MDDETARGFLARVAAGDEVAFTALYHGCRRRVTAFLLNQLRDPDLAEEVFVDVMHEVWRSAARFRGEALFSTWVLGIARNKALMVFRSRGSDDDHDDLDDHAETLVDDAALDGFAALASKQRREGVGACLQTLSEEHRECLRLLFFEGWSLEEIAAAGGVPVSTVKTRLHHARQKLRGALVELLEREGAQSLDP